MPRYTADSMDMYRVSSMEDIESLPKTKWNVSQPEDIDARENALDSHLGLDLILMPGLAFDKVCLWRTAARRPCVCARARARARVRFHSLNAALLARWPRGWCRRTDPVPAVRAARAVCAAPSPLRHCHSVGRVVLPPSWQNGERLGRGKGYYDTFLQRLAKAGQPDDAPAKVPYTIGIGFSAQLVDTIPTEPHDMKLDEVILPAAAAE